MKYRAHDIVYDTDGQEVDLPDEMEIELEEGLVPEEHLADAISDRTGFLVDSYEFEPAAEAKHGM